MRLNFLRLPPFVDRLTAEAVMVPMRRKESRRA